MEEEKKKYYLKIAGKLLILGLILLGIFVAYKVAIFYIPFLIALAIATMLEPMIRGLMKKLKIKRKLASTISLLIVVILIGSLLTLLISAAITESKELLGNLNEPFSKAYNWGIEFLNDIKEGRVQIPEEVVNTLKDSMGTFLNAAKDAVSGILNSLVNTVGSIPTMITYSFITLLAIIFICFDREYVKDRTERHVPKVWIKKGKEIVDKTCKIAWQYIKAEAKLSGICFCLVLIGLTIFDWCGLSVGYAVLMAILIGFVDLLPLFGAGAVMIPWTIYLFLTGNMPLAIAVLALWLVWAVIKNLMEPKFISSQMGLHPIFTLLGMYTGFRLFGVLGLMIGPILFLILKSVFHNLVEKGVFKSFFELE